jgi:hypothetical protein
LLCGKPGFRYGQKGQPLPPVKKVLCSLSTEQCAKPYFPVSEAYDKRRYKASGVKLYRVACLV